MYRRGKLQLHLGEYTSLEDEYNREILVPGTVNDFNAHENPKKFKYKTQPRYKIQQKTC